MRPRLASTIYIETPNDHALPLFPAEMELPAAQSHSFSTASDGQTEISLYLLHGTSARATEGRCIGRWRIAGLPSATAGQTNIRVDLLVDTQGTVHVSASTDRQPLDVTPCTDTIERVPVLATDRPLDPLGSIRQHINAGEREAARFELVDFLHASPRSVAAWALLATLLEDPSQRADCYRQILRIDPEHKLAAARLRILTTHRLKPSS